MFALPARALGLALIALAPLAHAADCAAPPLGKRELFLRGSMNAWAADEAWRFRWSCDRYEWVGTLKGEQQFKIADEDWSRDADFGAPATPVLTPRGGEIRQRFSGLTRLTVRMTDNTPPSLQTESCPAPPLGEATLYLRGSMNNWAATEDFAFAYHCDAYYLNVSINSPQEFKLADAAWTPARTFGLDNAQKLSQGAAVVGNLRHAFSGEHTLRLAFDAGQPRLSVGPRTFADPHARSVTDPVALSARFDSRSPADKQPFGAVAAPKTVSFGFTAQPGVESATLVVARRSLGGNQEQLAYTELARLPMSLSAGRWSASYRFTEPAIYGYHFEFTVKGQTYVLQNNKDTVYWTREKGSMGPGVVEEKPDSDKRLRRYRQTVYAADFKVPDWARDIVYYYIFPERFRNGDKRNDPRPGRERAQDRYQAHGVEQHPHWNEKPYRPGSGDGSDAIYNNDFFGGDLAGIIEKLDYIKALGANTLYMTPVFRAASNHKYDTADYKNIDPAFGTNEDFIRLTAEAAKRGIRVITDTSLNHVGSDSLYFDRFGNFGGKDGAFANGKINPASPYAGWFRFDASQTNPDKQYQGWVGVSDLPEIDKSSPAFRAFAITDPDSVTKLWLDRGAAGWRMDVAPWVPDDFWRVWRKTVKAHKPDALTVAETWFDASKYFLGDMFDSTMNYIFRNAVLDYANGTAASKIVPNLELMREAYPPQAFFALMNLLSTHDQARALHHFGYHDDGDQKALTLAKQRLRLAVFFQMTYPGAPTIYYGDEVGLAGGDDPYNRAPYPWADEGGQPDEKLLADFKRLTALRHANPVLRHGSLEAPLHVDDHVIVLARQDGRVWAITATNNATVPKTVTVKLPAGLQLKTLKDALGGPSVSVRDGQIHLTIPPLFGRVLVTP